MLLYWAAPSLETVRCSARKAGKSKNHKVAAQQTRAATKPTRRMTRLALSSDTHLAANEGTGAMRRCASNGVADRGIQSRLRLVMARESRANPWYQGAWI